MPDLVPNTDIAAAWVDVIQPRCRATITPEPLLFWGEENTVPETSDGRPAPFVYVFPDVEIGEFLEMGAGRGNNLQRTHGELGLILFYPLGWGAAGFTRAEQIASYFRSYSSGGVRFGAATVYPGVNAEAMVPESFRDYASNYVAYFVYTKFYVDQVG